MKVLTKNTDYAARALIALARANGAIVSGREISKSQGIPYQFLRRILQTLVQNGLVSAKEGFGGGVKLIVRPEKIRLNDIVRMFQGDIMLSECMFRRRLCPNRPKCPLRGELNVISRKIESELAKLTIGKLIKKL